MVRLTNFIGAYFTTVLLSNYGIEFISPHVKEFNNETNNSQLNR